MNLNSSTLSLDTLKGALLINPNGAKFRIAGFCFHPNEPTKIYVSIQQTPVNSSHCDTLCWASLADWDIKVQEVA